MTKQISTSDMRIMKRIIYTATTAIICLLSLTACSDSEDSITPSGNYSPIRGGFPQGDTEYDSLINIIKKEYGVYLLYKDITEEDLNRDWVSAGTGDLYVAGYEEDREMGAWDLPESHLPFYVSFFNDYIFPNISKEFANSTLPVKIYMIHNLRTEPRDFGNEENSGSTTVDPFKSLKLGNFDNWAISFKEEIINGGGGDGYELKQQRCIFMTQAIYNSIEKGEIIKPAEFWDGFTFGTDVLVNIQDENASNSMRNLGYVDALNDNFGTGHLKQLWRPLFTISKKEVSTIYWKENAMYDLFVSYVMNAMWLTPDEFHSRYNTAKYSMIKEKYDFVVKYMKETCGVDLVGIAMGKDR